MIRLMEHQVVATVAIHLRFSCASKSLVNFLKVPGSIPNRSTLHLDMQVVGKTFYLKENKTFYCKIVLCELFLSLLLFAF